MTEITMPDIKLSDIRLPEIRLRDVKLPDIKAREGSLRDMRSGLEQAAGSVADAIARIDLPGKVEDLVEDAAPRRRGPNPLIPIVGIVAVASALLAGWWFLTTTAMGARIRQSASEARQRMNGTTLDANEIDLDRFVQSDEVATFVNRQSGDPLREPEAEGEGDGEAGIPVGPGQEPVGSSSLN